MLNSFNSWQDAMQDCSQAIDDEFGEDLVLTFCESASVNSQPTPIPGADYRVRGVFRYRGSIVEKGGIRYETRTPVVEFHRDLVNCAPVVMNDTRQWHGSRVRRLTTGDLFQIESMAPDGVARIVCHLTQLGRQDLGA